MLTSTKKKLLIAGIAGVISVASGADLLLAAETGCEPVSCKDKDPPNEWCQNQPGDCHWCYPNPFGPHCLGE